MDISQVIIYGWPDSEWILQGEDYEGLDWLDSSPKPTKKQIESLWPEVQYEIQLKEVKHARHSAYTAAGGSDSVYLKYQRGEATEQEWLDAIQAINDAHPYPLK